MGNDDHSKAPEALELEAAVVKTGGSTEEHILKIPGLLGRQLSPDGKKIRLVCTLAGGKVRYQCALMPYGEGDFYVLLNRKNLKASGLKAGDRALVRLEPDTSRYGIEMPEELAEMLAQEPEINLLFHEELSDGRRRSFIYWVSQPRSSDKRLERALTLVEKFKQFGPKLSGDQLLGKA